LGQHLEHFTIEAAQSPGAGGGDRDHPQGPGAFPQGYNQHRTISEPTEPLGNDPRSTARQGHALKVWSQRRSDIFARIPLQLIFVYHEPSPGNLWAAELSRLDKEGLEQRRNIDT
jgi:hypothetical protein